jgi:protein Mpv17
MIHHVRSGLQWYSTKANTIPLLTKALTSLSLYTLGDILAQLLEQKKSFDKPRIIRLAFYAFLVVGPVSHYWYNFLEKLVEKKMKMPTFKAVVTKIAFDQFLFTPPMTVLFFTYMSLASGAGLNAAIRSVRMELFPTLKVNWVVWPIAHTVTFGVIPLEFRVLFVSAIAIFWACFLSLTAARSASA